MHVGGGVGMAVAEIVKAHPRIRGINFDLPDVVASAPKYPGVTHLGGDMFHASPYGTTGPALGQDSQDLELWPQINRPPIFFLYYPV